MSFLLKLSSFELEISRANLYASKGARALFIESGKWSKPFKWNDGNGSSGFEGFGIRITMDAPVVAPVLAQGRRKSRLFAAGVAAVALGLMLSKEATAEQVDGYFRKDGTYVQSHQRSERNNTTTDNYSTKGNTNPYTGKKGTKDPYYQRGY